MQETFRLSESINPGYVVVTADATSSRAQADISYSIVAGNERDSFEVLSDSGELRVRRALDYERIRTYNLWLSAEDRSTDPPLSDVISLTVDISDENDCVPVFDGLYFNASVPENEFGSVSVISVTASDCDSGDNGRVTYQLVSGNQGDAFSIDAITGNIHTQTMLDRERIDRYLLVVHATDHVSIVTRYSTAFLNP